MGSRGRSFLTGIAVLTFTALPGFGDQPKQEARPKNAANGSLVFVDGVRVLRLEGGPYERGVAHGKLLGQDIVTLIRSCLAEPRMIPSPEMYEQFMLGQLLPRMAFSAEERRELEGVFAGIVEAAGGPPELEALGRSLELRDLLALNCYADWRPLYCSSFSAWGPFTEGGEMITARNLDYPATDEMRDSQVVIAFASDGRHKGWVSVTWPGLIGCYTGMNADGVTVSMHDAGPVIPTAMAGFVPRSLALRRAIEAAGPRTPVEDVARVLTECPATCGSNVHVSGPAKLAAKPAGVIEYDGDTSNGAGVTIRWPSGEEPLSGSAIVCTNHYRERAQPVTCARYERLTAELTSIGRDAEKIDLPASRRLLASVVQRGGATSLHSATFLPDRRIMYVSFASDGVSPPTAPPVLIDVGRLLAAAPNP